MKQGLWLVNSSLVLMFACMLGVYAFLWQTPTPWRAPRISSLEELKKKNEEPRLELTWEQIYQEDLFDTFVAPKVQPTKKSYVTPIPEPKPAVIPPPPEIKKQEFVPALTITVRGIIAGGDELKNVAMIADETNKEGMYYLGEKIKDAQIIKIAHNRVVVLRANGQQEIFYLRKDDVPLFDQQPDDRWQFIVKKIAENEYEINPYEFVKEIETLGHFIERFAVIGTAFQGGVPIGVRIGKLAEKDLALGCGIIENDIITSINQINLADQKSRIKAYDTITAMSLGDIIKIVVKRGVSDISLSYKLAKIDRPRKKLMFSGSSATGQQPPAAPSPQQALAGQKEDLFTMSKQQQREQTVRDFSKLHPDSQRNQQAMMEIRRRILENLNNRVNNPR